MTIVRILFLILCLSFAAGPALAEDGAAKPAPAAQPEKGAMSDPTWDRRIELARKMNEIRPAAQQIDDAIDQIARTVPENDRAAFALAMKKILDYKTLEDDSVKAMATVFTLGELQAMVNYYSQPEARSISEKYGQYQAMMTPKITHMLDEAMMKTRTGEAGQPDAGK